jgi:hypothetical protein
MSESKEKRLNLSRMKGYKGWAIEGWKKVADKYDDVKWGNGVEPKEIKITPFKITYRF